MESAAHPFCPRCTAATMDFAAPGTFKINGIGTGLYGWGNPCLECGSVVKRLFFCVFWIPIFPIPSARYRVIDLPWTFPEGSRYVGRLAPRGGPAEPEVPQAGTDIHRYERELAECERTHASDDPETLRLRRCLGEVYAAAGHPVAALSLLEPVGRHVLRVFGDGHPETDAALTALSNARRSVGKPKNRIALLRGARDRHLTTGPGADFHSSQIDYALAEAYADAGRLDRCVVSLGHVYSATGAMLGPDHPEHRLALERLHHFCAMADNRGTAEDLVATASARARVLGRDHPDTVATRRRLQEILDKNPRTRRRLRLPPKIL